MEGQYLAWLDLSDLRFAGANLRGCNFYEATMFSLEAHGAIAEFANFHSANCFRASFMRTRLEQANLEGTNFLIAGLRDANLRNAIGLTQEQVNMAPMGSREYP